MPDYPGAVEHYLPRDFLFDVNTHALEQPSALGPFMGKFIMLASIAPRTSKHKIIRAIRAATRQRHDVIYFILIQFLSAPIALALLPLVLILNILSSMSSLGSFLTSGSIVIIDTKLLWMCLAILYKSAYVIFMMLFAQCLLLLMVFLKISIAIAQRFLAAALSAIVAYTAWPPFLRIEVFSRSRESLFTNCTLPCVFWRLRGFRPRTAIFTNWMQSIDASRMFMEVFGSCGFLLLALSAAFQYNIHAVETNPFYRHAQGCVQHRLSSIIFGELILP